jgi:hypothetical protein
MSTTLRASFCSHRLTAFRDRNVYHLMILAVLRLPLSVPHELGEALSGSEAGDSSSLFTGPETPLVLSCALWALAFYLVSARYTLNEVKRPVEFYRAHHSSL